MSNKAARTSKEALAPLSSPFAELLSQIQSGTLPHTDALAGAIANVQSKLAEWKPTGESDPFGFLFDRTSFFSFYLSKECFGLLYLAVS